MLLKLPGFDIMAGTCNTRDFCHSYKLSGNMLNGRKSKPGLDLEPVSIRLPEIAKNMFCPPVSTRVNSLFLLYEQGLCGRWKLTSDRSQMVWSGSQ